MEAWNSFFLYWHICFIIFHFLFGSFVDSFIFADVIAFAAGAGPFDADITE